MCAVQLALSFSPILSDVHNKWPLNAFYKASRTTLYVHENCQTKWTATYGAKH